jgi:hypothetical protein
MKELITKVLNHCGYSHLEPTEANLIECFLDYVDSGAFGNLDYEEAKQDIADGDITFKQICYNLLKTR